MFLVIWDIDLNIIWRKNVKNILYKLPKIFSIFQLNMLLNYSLSLIPK